MSRFVASIDDNGKIEIPPSIQNEMGIGPGDVAVLEVIEGGRQVEIEEILEESP